MDEHEKIDEAIASNQQKQILYCEERFMSKSTLLKIFWACLLSGLTLTGTGVGWALNSSNVQSTHEVRLNRAESDIVSLQSIHQTMDSVVTIVRQIRSQYK